jgi:hypothetical protein
MTQNAYECKPHGASDLSLVPAIVAELKTRLDQQGFELARVHIVDSSDDVSISSTIVAGSVSAAIDMRSETGLIFISKSGAIRRKTLQSSPFDSLIADYYCVTIIRTDSDIDVAIDLFRGII